MTNAVIYARYSSHGQTEQSIEGQLHDAYTYAERMEYNIIGEYIDRALTGTKDTRPDFQRMIHDAEKRQFQAVIVWKLDRFARNRYDSAIYKAKLKKCGVKVVSVMENITDTPEGIILEGLLESMAEYYSANLSENVKRGQKESVLKGWYLGGHPPYGYRVQDHKLVINEKEAPIAREIFRRYAAGEPISDIAADLNERGYRTRSGTEFRVSSFDSMIKNSAYMGRLVFGDQVIDCIPTPLVDPETYQSALQRRERNRRAPASAKAKERYLLHGKIFCGPCGSPMIGESGYGHSGTRYSYYICSARKKKRACKKKLERKDALEFYVCEQTLKYILSPEHLDDIAQAVVEAYEHDFSGDRISELERTSARLDAELNKLVDSLLTLPASARPRIGEKMERLEAQKADVDADLCKLRLANGIRLTFAQVKAWLSSFQSGDINDEDFRQKLIDTFVNSFYVYDNRFVIFYNVRGGKQINPRDLHETANQLHGSDLAVDALPETVLSEPGIVIVHGLIGLVIWR